MDPPKEAAFSKMKQLYAKPTVEENARCKVCFKKFQNQEFFRLCTICERKVCEDCSASYANKEPEVYCGHFKYYAKVQRKHFRFNDFEENLLCQ